ncbi:MAG: replicative DNA helicase [Bacteroidota bacterium]
MEPNKENSYFKKSTAFLSGQSRPANRMMDVGLGKIPPQALDLEEAVLGALMIEKDALTTVVDILKPQSFYKDAHQRIYNAILTLFKNSEPVDLRTVAMQLRKTAELEIAGGAFYITELTSRVNSAANIEYHARIIAQMSIKRDMISAASDILRDAYEDTTDVFQLLDRTEQALFSISESNIRKNYERMGALIQQAIEDLEKRALLKDGLTGVPTGFTSLDRVTSGWQKSDLVIMAARPGMGKTAFVVSAMRNAAVDFQKGVAIFSLEMSSVQLVNRLISAEAELESEKIKKGSLLRHEWEQLHHKIAKLTEAPIFIDDTPALSILELRAKSRRLKSQHDIQLIIIDYLQLMTGDTSGKMGGNREQEIASISRALKNLAKELDIPVIALSQLSRAVETRGGDKRPQLSDLRESGSIEQDADMVIFLYRPEYYGITQDEAGNSIAGIGEVIIAKHRNGSLETVPLKFIGKYTKFCDLDSSELRPFSGNSFPDSSSIPPEFSSPGTITLGSKVNNPSPFAPGAKSEDPPF